MIALSLKKGNKKSAISTCRWFRAYCLAAMAHWSTELQILTWTDIRTQYVACKAHRGNIYYKMWSTWTNCFTEFRKHDIWKVFPTGKHIAQRHVQYEATESHILNNWIRWLSSTIKDLHFGQDFFSFWTLAVEYQSDMRNTGWSASRYLPYSDL